MAWDDIARCDTAQGFVLLPTRWVVERTLAWIGRCRRLAKDWERTVESLTASTVIASIRMLTRVCLRPEPPCWLADLW